MLRFSSHPSASQVALALFGLGAGLMVFPLAGRLGEESGSSLRTYFEEVKAGEPFDLDEATSHVFRGTEHSDERRICFSENWLQWLAGQAYAPLLRTQDTELLIDGGRANCSERSQILKALAEAAGKKCRFVGLQGHVVLEVHGQQGWRMADPDYGLAYDGSVEQLSHLAAAPIVQSRLSGRGYPQPKIDRYLEILQSTADNTFLPVGKPISPRLHNVELACQWLVWILPSFCLVGGILAGGGGWKREFSSSFRRAIWLLRGKWRFTTTGLKTRPS